MRPSECVRVAASSRAVWAQARSPKLSAYCSAIARGQAALSTDPARALELARFALSVSDERWAGAHVLAGRTLLALGRPTEAWDRFRAALALDAGAVRGPLALRDLGLSARAALEHERALWAYRMLVRQVALVDDPVFQQMALSEAAAVAAGLGEAGLDEALGYLREARQRTRPQGLEELVLGQTALLLDRKGRADEAFALLDSAPGPWSLERVLAERDAGGRLSVQRLPLLPEGELDAVVAMLSARNEPELAEERWTACLERLEAAESVWVGHARAKLEALDRKKGDRR
jgi:tetratricopeptide (TPR) repeat protein